MTPEEAINIIKTECYVNNPMDIDRTIFINTALDKAVEALYKTSDKELIKQFKSIVRGDCIMLTKEAYSDLCLRAAGIIKEGAESCEDCISRQAAIKGIERLIMSRQKWLSDGREQIQGLNAALCEIEDLPPVKPEKVTVNINDINEANDGDVLGIAFNPR